MQIENIPTRPLLPFPRLKTDQLQLPRVSREVHHWLTITLLAIVVAFLIGAAFAIILVLWLRLS